MTGRSITTRALSIALTAAAILFAADIAIDTLRTVVPLWSPLPWFDEWATVSLLDRWQSGDASAAAVLFSQHNEHRILVPRLVFFADDALFGGGGTLSLACIFIVQALHAGLFAAVLARARPRPAGTWALAAVIVALMFSLRQEENFSSGFQLQFVAVFAGATLAFVLFALALARARAGAAAAVPLAGSLVAALLTAFTMANGLVAAWVLVVLAVAARARARVVLLCAAWAALITAVYFWGYEPVEHHSHPSEALAHPLDLARYVAAYLGSAAVDHRTGTAIALGAVGIALTAAAGWRAFRRGDARPASLAMLGVMLFVGAAAAITASGRMSFGIAQALSSRYVAGSVAFWAAQLSYWWIDPPGAFRRFGAPGRIGRLLPRDPASLPRGAGPTARLVRRGVAAAAFVLCFAVAREQAAGRLWMVAQSAKQNQSADLLMLGLDDPAVVERAAWTDEDVQRLLPTLKEDGLSIFGTADYAGLGRPVTDRGALGPPCEGAIEAARADPALGRDGVRVSGRALDGRRLVRRVLLADAEGRVVGLASGAVPGAPRGAWSGFAVAPAGTTLAAYGLAGGRGLCRIGSASVEGSPGAGRQASQPVAAP